MKVSPAFQIFMEKTPGFSDPWMKMTHQLAEASALDPKTRELTYLAVLAAMGAESGMPFHVQQALGKGATPDEILSAVLVGLPVAGHSITRCLPAVMEGLELKGNK